MNTDVLSRFVCLFLTKSQFDKIMMMTGLSEHFIQMVNSLLGINVRCFEVDLNGIWEMNGVTEILMKY